MRRLDRYIFAEVLGPSTLGFLVYTFILLIQALFQAADLLIGSGVSLGTVGQLLALSLPHIVVLSIPMSLLFGILIGIGRLSTDSELVAIRASGISLFSLFRPILLLSAILTALNVWVMLDVMPDGNRQLHRLTVSIATEGLRQEVQPRVPHTGWLNKVLYVFEAPPGDQQWRGVFLADTTPGRDDEVIIAERGQTLTDESGQMVIRLEDTVQHLVNLIDPTDYRALSSEEYTRLLLPVDSEAALSTRKGLRELHLEELRRRIDDPTTSEHERNLAKVELHKRFSFPAACLVFGLLGLPLGFGKSRSGRSAGFAVSLGVILVYYVIFNFGEESARDGTIEPWIAVWFPNVLFLAAGLFLLARRNRDKSLLLHNVDRWVQSHLWAHVLRLRSARERKKEDRKQRVLDAARRLRQTPAAVAGTRLVVRLPELRWRFPNTVDRYILRRWFWVLTMAGTSGLMLYIIADLTENVEDILKNSVPLEVVADYYRYKSFNVIYEISPIIVLVTTLVTFGLLSRTQEVTACKAAGLSLFRLAMPVIAASGLVAGLMGGLQSEILPASNSRMAQLKATIKADQTVARSSRSSIHRNWLFGQDNQLFRYGSYDPATKTLRDLHIFRFDERYRLEGRLVAAHATHVEGPWWIVADGWARTFSGDGESSFSKFDEPRKYRLEESPEYFEGGLTPPEEMNYNELAAYIADLREGGQDVTQLEIQLHRKLAYPILSLVMTLVALPFAFRLGRKGALYGVGISLVVGICLVIVDTIFTAMGEAAFLPPSVATWAPSLIFAIFSMYQFLGVRT
ncbi:MAG: LptF/LptG family permease [Thermoanaerobaculia bacterium]|nr:LptF/LptG family permease [Thermoanaerobaculia bacterium]